MSYPLCRWMIRRDLPTILSIESTAFPMPWTEDEFIIHLRQRNCIGLVAERDDEVLGYVLYELHASRLHVLNLAVRTESRRQGVGSCLINKLKEKLNADRRNRISLEVRESNLAAQLFFRSLGFRAERVLRAYYSDADDDAYQFYYRVKQSVQV